MRRLSSNYIFPVSSRPLKNGIIELDDRGVITRVIDTRGKLEETSKLEFYNGALVPGFVIPCCWIESILTGLESTHIPDPKIKDSGDSLVNTEEMNFAVAFNDIDVFLFNSGIRAAGIVSRHQHLFSLKAKARIKYHTLIELSSSEGVDPYEIFNSALNEMMTAYNEYSLPCSLIFSNIFKDQALLDLIISYSVLHRSIVLLSVLPGTGSFDEALGIFTASLAHQKGISRSEALESYRYSLLISYQHLPSALSYCDILPPHTFFLLSVDKPETSFGTGKNNLQFKHQQKNGFVIGLTLEHPKEYRPIIKDLFWFQEKIPGNSLDDLIKWITLNGARALYLDSEFGSFEPGKKPGVNLITDIDFKTFRLTPASKLHVLV